MRRLSTLLACLAFATAAIAADESTIELKDGSRIMMKNNAIWKQVTEHGTLKPGH